MGALADNSDEVVVDVVVVVVVEDSMGMAAKISVGIPPPVSLDDFCLKDDRSGCGLVGVGNLFP